MFGGLYLLVDDVFLLLILLCVCVCVGARVPLLFPYRWRWREMNNSQRASVCVCVCFLDIGLQECIVVSVCARTAAAAALFLLLLNSSCRFPFSAKRASIKAVPLLLLLNNENVCVSVDFDCVLSLWVCACGTFVVVL